MIILILNQLKIDELEMDYSILQATPNQLREIYFIIGFIRKLIKISENALQSLIFKVIVDWQVRYRMFYKEHQSMSSQERLKHAMYMSERGMKIFSGYLKNPDDIIKVQKITDKIMRWVIRVLI